MREQTGRGMHPSGTSTSSKTDQVDQPPASPRSIGHYAGFHGEDQPSTTTEPRGKRPATPDYETEEGADDDMLYVNRLPSSARRYQIAQDVLGAQQPPILVIQRQSRNRRRPEPPPAQKLQGRPFRRSHGAVFVGVGMLVMLGLGVLGSLVLSWWQSTQEDWQYGRPRTFQIDAVVGHDDSAASPTHFITLNLNRHVEIIEFPGGDSSKAKIYHGPYLVGAGQDLAPVTLSFRDVNGDGKLDMIVTIQETHFVLLNDIINGIAQFRPHKPGEHVTL